MLDPVLRNPWVRALGALMVFLVVVGILYLLLPILVSLMLSFLVAYILMPLVHYGEKIRIPRMVTIIVLLSIIVITAISMPLYLAANVIQETDSFITRAQEGFTEERLDTLIKMLPLRDLVIYLEWAPRGQQDFNEYAIIIEKIGLTIEENALELIQNYGMQVANIGSQAGVSAAQFVKSIGAWAIRGITFMVNLGLFLFITAYLLRDYDAFMSHVHEIVPPRYRTTIDEFAHKIDHQLQALLRGQITVCFCLAVMYAHRVEYCWCSLCYPNCRFWRHRFAGSLYRSHSHHYPCGIVYLAVLWVQQQPARRVYCVCRHSNRRRVCTDPACCRRTDWPESCLGNCGIYGVQFGIRTDRRRTRPAAGSRIESIHPRSSEGLPRFDIFH